jgi:hypothetical protein
LLQDARRALEVRQALQQIKPTSAEPAVAGEPKSLPSDLTGAEGPRIVVQAAAPAAPQAEAASKSLPPSGSLPPPGQRDLWNLLKHAIDGK